MAILVPKLGQGRIGQWLMARMKNPHYRVNLDEFGTWVWLHCDGHQTIRQIADGLKEEFGDKVQPVDERLKQFLGQLHKGHFITLLTDSSSSLDRREP